MLSVPRLDVKRTIENTHADYRWWLWENIFDDYVLVPLGTIALALIAGAGTWWLIKHPDVLICLLVTLVAAYFRCRFGKRGAR